MAITQLEMRGETARPELRRYWLSSIVLTINVVLAFAPPVIGSLVLLGVLR